VTGEYVIYGYGWPLVLSFLQKGMKRNVLCLLCVHIAEAYCTSFFSLVLFLVQD